MNNGLKERYWVSDITLHFRIREDIKMKFGFSDNKVKLRLTHREPNGNEIALYRNENCLLKRACKGRVEEYIEKKLANGFVSYLCEQCPQFLKPMMAYKSYRDLYRRVRKIPSDVKMILQKVAGVNQKRIVELLLNKPVEATVGEYFRQDRNVHLKKSQIWEIEGKSRSLDAIPEISVVSVISGLNALLKRENLHYAIWLERRVGSPLNQKGKIRLYKNKALFKIGLVDKNRPKKPEG